MKFNNPPRQNIRTYGRFTPAKKVKYTKGILRYLDEMEEKVIEWNENMGRAVAIQLDGMVRYVWRGDLLSKKEYDEVQKKTRAGIGMLRQKRGGDVGQSGSAG
ncbi:MAG: hypothetical protein JW704_09800 [Anaerolineaceae bacterium]|nr:hypothetical protein [Anaerolineaceae bacterium]